MASRKPTKPEACAEKALDYYVSVFQDKKADPKRRDHAAKMCLLTSVRGAALVLEARKRSLKELKDLAGRTARVEARHRRNAEKASRVGKKEKIKKAVDTAGQGGDFEGLL